MTARMVLAAACLASAAQAHAASSAWVETDGGRLRLVTTGSPDAHGVLRGALEVDLAPGWKTYWRDPGGSGVPPAIDISQTPGLSSAVLDFPQPARHQESDFSWVGYEAPVAFAATFTYAEAGGAGPFVAKVFLGICKTICLPVAADLVIDPGLDADDPTDAAEVADAFAALPEPARQDFRAEVISADDKRIIIQARVPPGSADVDLFVDQGDQYLLSVPARTDADGKPLFTIDATRPAKTPQGPGLPYTLVAGGKAVSGFIPYF